MVKITSDIKFQKLGLTKIVKFQDYIHTKGKTYKMPDVGWFPFIKR